MASLGGQNTRERNQFHGFFSYTINICLLFLLIGSMQPQSLPHQYPAFHQLLLQPGQTAAAHAHHAALLQQPIMSQAQPVTSIAGGLQQFPYPVHQSHGVVPGQQNSPQPQFIIQPHGMPMAAVQTVGQAGGQGTPVGGAPGVGGQMQGPPGGPGQ